MDATINKQFWEDKKNQFPLLQHTVNGKALVYLDSGATTQKPLAVIEALENYYSSQNANIHRGVHTLSQEITTEYEKARTTVQNHINALHSHEIIFNAGTTAAVNMVATCIGKNMLKKGDEIIITEMEHHSNILPWQQICDENNAVSKVITVSENGELNTNELEALITSKTKVVALTHVSNTLGTINPVKEIIRNIRTIAARFNNEVQNQPCIFIDGAQAVPHLKVNVQDLDADFYCFSAHKLFGPTGVGVLYGKSAWLEKLPNYQVGGGTIETVTFEKTTYAALPLRFEAGTPNIAGVIGLAAAIDYVNQIGLQKIGAYEHELLQVATLALKQIKGLKIIGEATNKAAVISFVIDGIHPYDIGMILDKQGIAVRTGHHCTQPLMNKYKIPGTVRASFAFYNTFDDIDALVNGVQKAVKMLS